MKRILFLAEDLRSGGAERQMVSIAIALKEMGNDVSFVCYKEGDFYGEYLENANIPVSWIIKNKTLQRLLFLRRFIRKGHYDVVISFLETANILNLFAGLGGRNWKIITGERSSKRDNLTSVRGHIVAFLQKYTDKLVCNSRNAQNMWEQYYPILKDKITVIYNCVNIQDVVLEKDYLDNALTRIVVAASYRAEKNPLNLIEAIGLLSQEYKAHLCIEWYGGYDFSGNLYAVCEERIKEQGTDGIIHLYGPSKHIHQHMLEADYVALLSKFEGMPNAICEAMALGIPIIMTQVSDYNVLLDNNGILCTGDDPDTIKSAIEKAIDKTAIEREEMGRRSKVIAQSLFSKQIVISSWVNLIESL